jgi:[ribosomal protein S5]-alanine N-acetyltransferase
MNTFNLVVETENLFIKSITTEYKECIFKEFTVEITTYMFPKPAEKIEETINFINSSIEKNNQGSDF